MIKNLLYSIFLHSILLILIFFSFRSKKLEETAVTEITVSLGDIAPKPIVKPQEIKEIPKIEEKKFEEKKPEEKKIIEKKPEIKKPAEKIPEKKSPPKKEDKSKKDKVVAPVEKKSEVKKPEEKKKVEEKKPEVKKTEEKKIEEKKPEEKPKEEPIKKPPEAPIPKIAEKIVEPPKPKEEAPPKQDIIGDLIGDLPDSLENINLSPREKFNIQSQLNRCYKKTVHDNRPKIKITVVIKAKISIDGQIESNLDDLIDHTRYNNTQEPDYKIAIDNVKKAIALCNPLRNLPSDKYDIWKEVSLEFDEENLH